MLVPVNRSVPLDTWIVIFENKTVGREWVANILIDKSNIYGSFLSFWSIILNLFVCLIIAAARWKALDRNGSFLYESKNACKKNNKFVSSNENKNERLTIAPEKYMIRNPNASQGVTDENLHPKETLHVIDSDESGSADKHYNESIYGNLVSQAGTYSVDVPIHSWNEGLPAEGRALLTLNFSVVQALIAGLIIPANLVTNSEGHWVFGPDLCRAWLILQILLLASTQWTIVVITFHKVIRQMSSRFYARFIGRKVNMASLMASWMFSIIAVFPLGFSLSSSGDVVVENLCAVTLSRDDTVVLCMSAFLFPAALTLAGTAAILLKSTCSFCRKNQSHTGSPGSESNVAILSKDILKKSHKSCNGTIVKITNGDISTGLHGQDKPISECDSLSCKCSHSTKSLESALSGRNFWSNLRSTCLSKSNSSSRAAVVAVNLACVVMWLPFFVAYFMMPFCENMCIHPALWTVMIWFGYSVAGVAPLLWFVERAMRQQAVTLFMCIWPSRNSNIQK